MVRFSGWGSSGSARYAAHVQGYGLYIGTCALDWALVPLFSATPTVNGCINAIINIRIVELMVTRDLGLTFLFGVQYILLWTR